MKVKIKVWRQKNASTPGEFKVYDTPELNPNMSFLEMMDVVNEELTVKGEDPIAFDHDCREGICGTCSLVIDGKPHGPHKAVATCQTYMRSFSDGDLITVEHNFTVLDNLTATQPIWFVQRTADTTI